MCNAWNHPADCECGFGGDTYVGSSIVVQSWTWRYREDDFCRATTCPVCGAEVYFVRHNGGSVWFDELGPPWLKHGCFDDDPAALRTHAGITKASTQVLGVVTETIGYDGAPTGVIKVRCSDGTMVDSRFKTDHLLLSSLPGRLVAVRRARDGH